MSFSPNFTAEQLSNLTSVTVTDTSTGSDGSIASRVIYFQDYNGNYIVPDGTTTDYISFPLSDGASITIDNLLDKSYALNVTVQWLNSGGTALYTLTLLRGYPAAIKYGLYQLTQYQIPSGTKLLELRNYLNTKLAAWDAVLSGDNAVEQGSDITNAQRCYDKATNLLANPSNFY